MFKDYFLLGLNNITRRKLRSWLTLLGIFIGIAAVVALISVGQGMRESINQQFEQFGIDKISIQPGAVQMGAPGTSVTGAKLSERDLSLIKNVDGVQVATGYFFRMAKLKYKDKISYEFVNGIGLDDESKRLAEESQSYKIARGRNIEQGDKYDVVIGYAIANGDVFDKEIDVRDTINIQDKEFRVVGILEKIGNRYDDGSIVIPIDTAREIFNTYDEYSMIVAKVEDYSDIDAVAERIKKVLRKDRNLEKGEEDFSVQTSEQLIQSFNNILNIIQLVFVSIAAISLVVGGIGIMNTMYTSVLERTKEIGIMKAVGAKNSHILSLFLIESGLLGLIGGVIGIAFGIGLSKGVEIIASQAVGGLLKASFPLELIFGALAFSFLIGCISGVLPALQASRLKPVDALRY